MHDHDLPPDVPTCCLFVYGTLRSGQPNSPRLGGATLLGSGTVTGTLVNLGDYPGLVPGDSVVVGELYRLPTAALDRIDALEGYDPDDPDSSLFVRQEKSVVMESGQSLVAWTYLWPHRGGESIASGDWLAHLAGTRGGYPPVPWL